MDINIFNGREKKTSVQIISDIPEMKSLLLGVLSLRYSICERDGHIAVICTREEAEPVSSAAVYIGKMPKNGALMENQLFLSRPLSVEELLLAVDGIVSSCEMSCEGFSLNTVNRHAFFKDRGIGLTQKEAELFMLLLSNMGRCVSREEITEALWKKEDVGNSADVYACHLRKKLESISCPGVLISVRGRGYMLKKP